MHPNFTLPNQRNFHVSNALPLNYSRLILRGSNVLTATDPSAGCMVLQELANTRYTIRFNIFSFLKPVQLLGYQAGARLISLLALTNNLHYYVEGMGILHLKQGQFALLHTTGAPLAARFTKTKAHEYFEISWSDEWLAPLLTKFKFLEPVFSAMDKTTPFLLQPRPRPAGIKALDLVNNMLTTPYDADISRMLFENQVHEYLILLLVEASKKERPLVHLTEIQRDALIKIGDEVRAGYNKQFHIAALSRAAGMNATTLKNGFREIHGEPVSRLHMTARMREARRLLMETDLSTKQIAEMVGYALTTSFLKNFKKFFGYHASEVPRK